MITDDVADLAVRNSTKAVDRFSFWPLVSAFFVVSLIALFGDEDFRKGPAVGLALVHIALLIGPPFLMIWIWRVWRRFSRQGWRSGVSLLLGLPLGVLGVPLLSGMGWSPHRVQFEVMRPYYLAQVWQQTAVNGRVVRTFALVDTETWTGHFRREVVYESDEHLRKAAMTMDGSRECRDGASEFVRVFDLHGGFYMRSTVSEYGGCQNSAH